MGSLNSWQQAPGWARWLEWLGQLADSLQAMFKQGEAAFAGEGALRGPLPPHRPRLWCLHADLATRGRCQAAARARTPELLIFLSLCVCVFF